MKNSKHTYRSTISLLEKHIEVSDSNFIKYLTLKYMIKDVRFQKSIQTRITNNKSNVFVDIFQFVEFLLSKQFNIEGTYKDSFFLKYKRLAVFQIFKKVEKQKRFKKNDNTFNQSEFIKMIYKKYGYKINHNMVKKIIEIHNESIEEKARKLAQKKFNEVQFQKKIERGKEIMKNIKKSSFV